MAGERSTETGHKGRTARWVMALVGVCLVMGTGACGVATPLEDSEMGVLEAAEEVATDAGTDGGTDAGSDAGTVGWRGACTADSECNPAAAALCGDDAEMYCKFPQKRDGGYSTNGTCECRFPTPPPN